MSAEGAQHNPQVDDEAAFALEPESDDSNSVADSAVGGVSYASSTTSANSEVYAHVEEFGRTYAGYKAGKYLLPNDEKERDRLDLQHEIFLMLLDGKLQLAPIEDPRHVLDMATGTGIWAMDFADTHPNARIIGTDLSPIQPTYTPPNLTFEIHDAEDEWSFRPFDYIHGRALLSCFTSPRSILQKCFDNLSPGGYLELQDGTWPFSFMDPQPSADNPAYLWGQYCLEASIKAGRPWNNAHNYAQWMRELGFVDVVEKKFKVPVGPWAKGDRMKKFGVYLYEDLSIAMEPLCLKMYTKLLGWNEERCKEFAVQVLEAMRSKKTYMYETMIFVYGRKPSSS